ncbi:eukaryotic translation initiation factor 5A-1 isoform X3 [Pan paniscus]|uniref:eukaryotic translation initiation factor 5A-1 isoform X3 n=1 Tax=Pan paniscus TaxID=9597 RepID=UPI0015619251
MRVIGRGCLVGQWGVGACVLRPVCSSGGGGRGGGGGGSGLGGSGWARGERTGSSQCVRASWNRSLLKWQMTWTSRQEMQGPQPPSQCSAQHYVRMALWCSKAGHVRSSRCLLRRLASTATPRLEFHLRILPSPCLQYLWRSQQQAANSADFPLILLLLSDCFCLALSLHTHSDNYTCSPVFSLFCGYPSVPASFSGSPSVSPALCQSLQFIGLYALAIQLLLPYSWFSLFLSSLEPLLSGCFHHVAQGFSNSTPSPGGTPASVLSFQVTLLLRSPVLAFPLEL